MITTGIIKEINISEGGLSNNKYKVEVGYFQTPGDTNKDNYTFTANCSVPGGLYAPLNVGDKVYVSFINGNISNIVILGKIYQGVTDETRGYEHLDSLTVDGTTKLSRNTSFGEITYDRLDRLLKKNEDFVDEEILIGKDKSPISSGVPISVLKNQTEYSADTETNEEHKVGTWFGTDLYRKTYTYTPETPIARSSFTIDLPTDVVLAWIDVSHTFLVGGGGETYKSICNPFRYATNNYWDLYVDIKNNYISSHWYMEDIPTIFYITLLYTKAA